MKRLASLVLVALATGSALAAERPVVVELFTSLACSDCPPADALLARMRERYPDVLALDLHVSYWNDASWSDPYSLRGVDERQSDYAALRHDSQVYTPEAVVDGGEPFIGSDSGAMAAAIEKVVARVRNHAAHRGGCARDYRSLPRSRRQHPRALPAPRVSRH